MVESLTGNGVVSTRANLSSQAIVEYDLANNLGEDGHTKDHPRNLESPSEDIQVSGSKNKGDGGHVGNTGSSRVVPRQELREKGVVVSERLASGSGSRGSASSSSEVGELVGSLLSVVVDVLRNGAVGNRLVRSSGVGFGGLEKRAAVDGRGGISHFDELARR